MGFRSAFVLYCKHNKFEASEEEKQKMAAVYAKYNKENDWLHKKTDKECEEDLPYVMSMDFNTLSRKNRNLAEIRNNYFIEGHPADRLLDIWLCSDSKFIADELYLGNGNSWKDREIAISKSEAEQMLVAIEYLLAGEYSKKIESILSNHWIKAFGCHYPKYYYKKDRNHIYLEKTEPGSYTLTIGDDSYDAELDEENDSAECMMKRIRSILDAFVNSDLYDNDEELVLVYEISY